MYLQPVADPIERMSSPPPTFELVPDGLENDYCTVPSSPIEWEPEEEEAPFKYSIFEDDSMQHLLTTNPKTDKQLQVNDIFVPKIFIESE